MNSSVELAAYIPCSCSFAYRFPSYTEAHFQQFRHLKVIDNNKAAEIGSMVGKYFFLYFILILTVIINYFHFNFLIS